MSQDDNHGRAGGCIKLVTEMSTEDKRRGHVDLEAHMKFFSKIGNGVTADQRLQMVRIVEVKATALCYRRMAVVQEFLDAQAPLADSAKKGAVPQTHVQRATLSEGTHEFVGVHG